MKYKIRDYPETHIKESLKTFDTLTQTLLKARGIENEEDAEKFFDIDYDKNVHHPSSLNDIEKAVDRVIDGIENEIMLVSDCDCDGVSSLSIMDEVLQRAGNTKRDICISDRNSEGHGLMMEHIERAIDRGINLIITMDCGSSDIEELNYAKEKGIDVIVIDHHTLPDADSGAYALVNPKRIDSTYQEGNICGAALAFKFGWLMREKTNFAKEGWEKWLLDIVAIATVADSVPMNSENKVLTHYGLIVLSKTRRVGLRKLLESVSINSPITEDDIGFSIAPIINSAFRMGSPRDAFNLLVTDDVVVATALVNKLKQLNIKRRSVVAQMTKKIQSNISNKDDNKSVWCFGDSSWRPSLLGLVANTMQEKYGKPIFVWGRNTSGNIKGSCRGPVGVDLLSILDGAKDSMNEYGGHKEAAGFAVRENSIHNLEDTLSKVYDMNNLKDQKNCVVIDAILSLSDVSRPTYTTIRKFAPFGMSNNKPIFVFRDVMIKNIFQFGKNRQHIKYVFEDFTGVSVNGISFFNSIVKNKNDKVTVYANIEPSYRNYGTPQLKIIDII